MAGSSQEREAPRGIPGTFLRVLGPGIVVMMADNEAGSITTAAVSGAQWGYRLVLLQILLVPVLFVIQEMAARLGAVTGKGLARLIREEYGVAWASVLLTTLLITNGAALATEFAGVAGAGALFGIPALLSVPLAALFLARVVLRHTYRGAERMALLLGTVDLLFLPAAFLAHPNGSLLVRESLSFWQPLGNREYLLLVAGNIGAVIMPWMLFYQQGAVVDKGLRREALPWLRWDTALGAVATQTVMIAIIVAAAATLPGRQELGSAGQAAASLAPVAGPYAALLFALALTSSSMLGALVVAMSTAWSFAEVFGWPRSLDRTWQEAPWFYSVYLGSVFLAAALVLLPGIPLIRLTVDVEAGNAFILLIVLTFLLLLTNNRKLLGPHANRPAANLVAVSLSLLVAGVGLAAVFRP